jgi:hypothetical protein
MGILTFSLDEMTGIQGLERIARDKPSNQGKSVASSTNTSAMAPSVSWVRSSLFAKAVSVPKVT